MCRRYIIALIKRWWHGLFRLHQSFDVSDWDDGVIVRGCQCGRIFFATDGYKKSPAWAAAKVLWKLKDDV